MARPRLTVPSYRKHAKTGRAAVTIRTAEGTRTEVLLPGRYGSDEIPAKMHEAGKNESRE